MSFRDTGSENDTMEVPDFETPDVPLPTEDAVADGAMIRESVLPLIASSYIMV
jgi:hypothetical protein